MKLKFFIMAAGMGTRAAPLSDYRAKPAFPLLGVPLLTRMAEQLLSGNEAPENGWVNLHHRPESVRSCLKRDWPIVTVYEPVLSGSRILTRSLEEKSWSHLLVINGDVYCHLPLAELMAFAEGHDGALLVREIQEEGRYRTLLSSRGCFEKRGPLSRSGLMYTGVCLLGRKVVEGIRSRNFFDDLEENRFSLSLCPYAGNWLDFGDPPSYYRANIRCLEEDQRPDRDLWSPGARVESDSGAVKRTILWPGSRVKEGVKLDSCIVCDGVVPLPGRYREGIWTDSGFIPF